MDGCQTTNEPMQKLVGKSRTIHPFHSSIRSQGRFVSPPRRDTKATRTIAYQPNPPNLRRAKTDGNTYERIQDVRKRLESGDTSENEREDESQSKYAARGRYEHVLGAEKSATAGVSKRLPCHHEAPGAAGGRNQRLRSRTC